MLEEGLLNQNQSGFCPGGTCINQVLTITHEILEVLDCNPYLEVRSVFFGISKVFDKIWHEDLLRKIKSMDISGELHNLPESYLSGRLQSCFKCTNVIVETSFGRRSPRFNFSSTFFSHFQLLRLK